MLTESELQQIRDEAERLYPGTTLSSRTIREVYISALTSEREKTKELVEALKPFAEMFGELTESKVQQGGIVFQYNKTTITVFDFLRASAALTNYQKTLTNENRD